MIERDPERAELLLVPAGAEPEHEAVAGHLRDQPRRVEGGAGNQRPELDPLRGRGERAEQRPRLPRPALGRPVAAIEEMVADPDRVEARLLGSRRHGDELGPRHEALDLRKLDPDAGWSRGHGRSLCTVLSVDAWALRER